MEKWPLFRTILKNSSMEKSGKLLEKLRGQVSKTDFYDFLNVYENRGLILRPSRGAIMLVRSPSFWEKLADFLDRKAERKERERERVQREIDELDVEAYALVEEMCMDEEEVRSKSMKQLQEEKVKRRQKYRKLITGSKYRKPPIEAPRKDTTSKKEGKKTRFPVSV